MFVWYVLNWFGYGGVCMLWLIFVVVIICWEVYGVDVWIFCGIWEVNWVVGIFVCDGGCFFVYEVVVCESLNGLVVGSDLIGLECFDSLVYNEESLFL